MRVSDSVASVRVAFSVKGAPRIPQDRSSSAQGADLALTDAPPLESDWVRSAAYRACRKNPAGGMRPRAVWRAHNEPSSGGLSAGGYSAGRSHGTVVRRSFVQAL